VICLLLQLHQLVLFFEQNFLNAHDHSWMISPVSLVSAPTAQGGTKVNTAFLLSKMPVQ
jgi:hypothetical protein